MRRGGGEGERKERKEPDGRKEAAVDAQRRGRRDLESGGLASAVGSDETEHLAGARRGHAMDLEAVRAVAMRRVLLHVLKHSTRGLDGKAGSEGGSPRVRRGQVKD
eukprot:3560928-Rhodomonas_salina.1